MKPLFTTKQVTAYVGDCRDVLKTLPDESANCCVTSPPYWGLRDYGTATWEGGDEGCDHEPEQSWIDHNFNASSAFGNGAGIQSAAAKKRWYKSDGSCPRCGARRIDAQLGLEPTPDEYVAEMVAVFREVRRILRDDGTLWLNLGDSYASGEVGRRDSSQAEGICAGKANIAGKKGIGTKRKQLKQQTSIRPKNLVGIPWRVAFALQADGWYLRQDIIWHKPNPMPESVTDRCTKSHEYIFLLSKSARYFYDAEAVAENAVSAGEDRGGGKKYAKHYRDEGNPMYRTKAGLDKMGASGDTRNRHSVWTVATQPYSGAHFATFPPKLIEPCILAGCPVAGVVLDPFAGSGTTGAVASVLERRAILIDLSGEYLLKQALARTSKEAVLNMRQTAKVRDPDGGLRRMLHL